MEIAGPSTPLVSQDPLYSLETSKDKRDAVQGRGPLAAPPRGQGPPAAARSQAAAARSGPPPRRGLGPPQPSGRRRPLPRGRGLPPRRSLGPRGSGSTAVARSRAAAARVDHCRGRKERPFRRRFAIMASLFFPRSGGGLALFFPKSSGGLPLLP